MWGRCGGDGGEIWGAGGARDISAISPYISPISPLHLPYISPASPLHLPCISPTSPLHLAYISQAVEDRLNAAADSEFGVQSIILVEDNVKFYSTYMPLLYHELWKQNQSIKGETMTVRERMLRMKSRPKVYLPYISPISPLYLAYISPISPHSSA